MSMESLNALNLSEANLPELSSLQPLLLLRLQQALISCSTSIECGDFRQSEKSISELADFLNSVTENNDSSENDAFQVLMEIHKFITSPSLDQAVIDALSFELPKAVARFACVSRRCLEIAGSVIDRFIETCSPRDMLSILCEALDSPSEMFKAPGYFAPLLSGLAKVFLSIQRRQFEQVKEAVPVIINVLKAMSSELDEGDTDYEDLLNRSIDVANSIQAVCVKLDGKLNERLRAVLGLYVLQIMAFVSIGIGDKISSCLSLMLQLSHFLRFCNLSYLGLITGCDVDTVTRTVVGADGDDYMRCFSHVKHGASLSVIWGYISNEVAQAAEEDLAAVKAELSSNQTKRWQALGMLRNIFSCGNLPWELKKQAINFLLCIVDGNVSHEYNNEHVECSIYMPSLLATLQAVEMVVIYAPDAVLRRNAFDALKKVLADIPTSLRFDTLMALIKNTDSSSMIAILIDCVRKEMHMENCRRISIGDEVIHAQNNACDSAAFWNAGALELVELILRPPMGGPPSLPEYGDAVLSALNLYRFILMKESTGNTNYTGVLSKKNLQKAYNEWLLPLRTLVTGIVAENKKDYDRLAMDTVCVLNPVELVLYHCIELVEEKLKYAT
ncbi:Aberrant root formation protein 4 [Camellia lanceoleosa]|uniref:Aberrant root formation protein 4 n=1 Tax=Camellia lanceoleosa TaxID=1840588 RepID=A0ACC0FGC4_9ERIC|nr:Aberrant root formation protein 4 [Camellia lanceoleosa]